MAKRVSEPYLRLREMCKVFGIAQKDICLETGIKSSVISLYFNNKRQPRQDKIDLIASTYGINPAWLIGFDVPMMLANKEDFAESYMLLLYRKLNDNSRAKLFDYIDMLIKTQ